ncbi:MAG: hypothetical protein V3W14_11190, partial [Candidatus Neomarinimicrobiota bacterium]
VFKIHQPDYRDLHSYIKDEASLEVLNIENRLEPLRLEAYSLAGRLPEEQRQIKQEIDALGQRRRLYNVARKQMLEGSGGMFTKRLFSWTRLARDPSIGEDGLMDIEEHVVPKAHELWQRAKQRILGQVGDVERILGENRIRKRTREQVIRALNLPAETDVPLSFVVGLDLSDAGVVVGPHTTGKMFHLEMAAGAFALFEWLMTTDWQAVGAALPEGTLHALATEPWSTTDAQPSFAVGEVAAMTSQVPSYGLPHMSWATLDAYRAKIDTPGDHVNRLDWKRLAPQVDLTAAIIRRLAQDGTFQPEPTAEARLQTVEGRIVAQSPGDPMARFPQRGYLASLIVGSAVGGIGRYDPFWPLYGRAGMRRQEFAFTGWDGRFYVRDCPTRLEGWGITETSGRIGWMGVGQLSLQAHRLAHDGRIVGTIDLRTVTRQNSHTTWLEDTGGEPLLGTVFNCKEMNAFHLYDPRFLMEMGGISVVDAYRGNEPKRLNFGLHDGIMSGLMPPDVRWQVIQRTGITSNRLMLLNLQEAIHDPSVSIRDASAGFAMGAGLARHPTHQAAHDMYLLDERRLADYRRAGIISETIDSMRDRTKTLLGKVDEAVTADDGGALFSAATGALANEIRAYKAIRDLGNDVVRAVVILLLLLMPFSFAMERLLFSSPHPYRQMAHTSVIFALMTVLLWSFHPAFRITNQPLVIIMAFAIIFMSIMVVAVIFFKFKSNIEEMKSEHAEASGAQTSRLGLVSTAIKLGLANMRKRRLRTALTGITIVLITFAMLCFTSTSTYVGGRDLPLELEKPAP